MAIYYWVGGTGTWSGTGNTQFAITSGGVATLLNPTSADTVNFDANSGTAATVTVTSTAVSLGTVINKADITLSLSGSPTLCTSAGTLNLTAGTLDLVSHTLSTGLFNASNSNARSIAFGTGNITLTGNNTTVWNVLNATNFSYTGTPTVNATYSGSTGSRQIGHGTTSGAEASSLNFNISAGTDSVITTANSRFKNLNFTGFSGTLTNTARFIFGNLTISSGMTLTAGATITHFVGTSGTQQVTTNSKTLDFPLTFNGVGGTFAFQDALTQGSTRAFTITNGTVQLKNGVTSTVGVFATSTTTQKFLQSTLAGSQATLSQASGTVNASYLTIKDINATGGATWNALWSNNNVDAGGNSGWVFGNQPIINAVEYTYQIRSFTQPRRF
jgi:hypothetical protein